jgi:hypothetical protein
MRGGLANLKAFLEDLRFDHDAMKAFVDAWDGQIDDYGYVSVHEAKSMIHELLMLQPENGRPYALLPVVLDNKQGWTCRVDDYISRKDDGYYAIENLPFGD